MGGVSPFPRNKQVNMQSFLPKQPNHLHVNFLMVSSLQDKQTFILIQTQWAYSVNKKLWVKIDHKFG